MLLILFISSILFALHFFNEILTIALYLAISALQLALALCKPLSDAFLGAADAPTFLLQYVLKVLSALNVLFKVFFESRLLGRHCGLALRPPVHISLRERVDALAPGRVRAFIVQMLRRLKVLEPSVYARFFFLGPEQELTVSALAG